MPDFRGLTPKNQILVLHADARFLSWETLTSPGPVFCGARKEAGGPAIFFRFWRQTTVFKGLTPKNRTLILHADARSLSWETLAPPA